MINGYISQLVDERVNALYPCLKERIQNGEDITEIISEVVHKGFECKGCTMNPISGVRYECPKCINFNLCENCEVKIDHEHNLLKIKKITEKKNDKEDFQEIKHFFKKIWKEKVGKRDSSSEGERCHRKWKGHKYHKKIWGLSFLFGGEPDQYSTFAEQNEDLSPRETFRKYAKEQNISDEEFNQRFVAMRCQKLSKMFGKEPETYKKIVEETIDLGQKEMIDAIYEKGIEKR